jgi:predicted RNase H-like HicB family nuclease
MRADRGNDRTYRIDLFWSQAGGAWFADVPDLQSCSAFGNIPVEAQAELN